MDRSVQKVEGWGKIVVCNSCGRLCAFMETYNDAIYCLAEPLVALLWATTRSFLRIQFQSLESLQHLRNSLATYLLALPVLLRLLFEPVRDGLIAHRFGLTFGDLAVFVDTTIVNSVDPSLIQQNDENGIVSETSQARGNHESARNIEAS